VPRQERNNLALAAEGSRHDGLATRQGSRPFRVILAAVLMGLAANCFLKYLWWAACYSAWYGIPKLAEQWRAAGTRASLNLWSVFVLDLAGVAVLFTLLRLPSSNASGFVRIVPRLVFAFIITIAGTAVLALALSWVKQGIR
jgi:hypothetical protein